MNDLLNLKYIPVSELASKFLEGNSKRHDIGQIWDSIQRYGFRDPLGYDATLNNGKGGIVEGNGRLETLVYAIQGGFNPPRGIKLDESGVWYAPVLYGVDASSESEAKAYSLDHNTLVLSGGEFTALDASKLYESEGYMAMLNELAEAESLPLTVDGDDLDLLNQLSEQYGILGNGGSDDEYGDDGASGNPDAKFPLAIVLTWAEHQDWKRRKADFGVKSDKAAWFKLMER